MVPKSDAMMKSGTAGSERLVVIWRMARPWVAGRYYRCVYVCEDQLGSQIGGQVQDLYTWFALSLPR